MPRNLMSDFSEMASEISPNCTLGNLERSGSMESRRSQSRCRNFTLDDESLKYLTHEEKDVLMFFEETIDSLEDDFEDQVLHDSGIHCHSPRSTEENASSHSETEDIIDLVQSTPESSDHEDSSNKDAPSVSGAAGRTDSPKPEDNKQPERTPPPDDAPVLPLVPPLNPERFPPPPVVQHPKLLRSVPTPLILAQKISEKQMENRARAPGSPKEVMPVEKKKVAMQNGDYFPAIKHPLQPAPKPHRFPSNINITNISSKEFSQTISKAAVNVQERRAQVLANINGGAFWAAEIEERLQKNDLLGRNRSSSLKDLTSEQTRYEALMKLGLAKERPSHIQADRAPSTQKLSDMQSKQAGTVLNGYQNIHEILTSEPSPFLPVGKTVMIKPPATIVGTKSTQQKVARSFNEDRQADLTLDIRRRSGSLPRPSGFRPQGITVQFSGRGSTEEARKEALRKLGLLKETL
ncbi:proline and serine-rich protein 2 [Alligator mississippiensis]|nr:proline and serine-rich protein 2 [Alligator mississippiensis]XP_014463052.1 proline and serine-rich protein 2 [Alligator mississippiensis]XP_019343112.1 proline and serine-rich protein 2 [Alligator mississippiensis]